MRASSLLLLISTAVALAGVQAAEPVQGTFGMAATTNVLYGFGLASTAPFVNVVTSGTATATVNVITTLTAGGLNSFGVSGLPDGITTTDVAILNAAVGLQVDINLSASTLTNIVITLPALTVAQQSTFTAGVLGVLYFDVETSTYVKLPASAVTLDGSNQLVITYNKPGYFWLVNFSTAPVQKSIANGAAKFLVAANAVQSFAIKVNADANAQVALTIANMTAAAGSVTVSVSADASADTQAAVTGGRVVLSQIYNITHESADKAVKATLVFYAATSTAAATSFNAATMSWYRLEHGTTAWVKVASTIHADASVSAEVTGFSDWAAQADSSSSSSSTGTNNGNGAASAHAPAMLVIAALASLLLAW